MNYICKNNHENDFFTAIINRKIKKNHIYYNYIYSNIDD